MQQQNLPRCCSAKPKPDPDAPGLAEQVLLCPHDLPADETDTRAGMTFCVGKGSEFLSQ